MEASRVALYVTGAVLELAGILLVGAPDLLPYTERASRWLRFTTRRLIDRVRLAIGRPRGQVIQVGMIDSMAMVGDNISLISSVNPEATLEERVEYLLRRDQESQTRLNEHGGRLSAIEEQLPKGLDELQSKTEEHVSREITAAEWKYRPARFVGALALLCGLALTTTANFS